MDLSPFFKSVIDSDTAPVVICDTEHTIVYMNPSAVSNYSKRGGLALVGRSLLGCHDEDSVKKIKAVVDWFGKSPENNRVFTFYNEKQNKDVYMIALRDDRNQLIGYYEKHEFRNREASELYENITI